MLDLHKKRRLNRNYYYNSMILTERPDYKPLRYDIVAVKRVKKPHEQTYRRNNESRNSESAAALALCKTRNRREKRKRLENKPYLEKSHERRNKSEYRHKVEHGEIGLYTRLRQGLNGLLNTFGILRKCLAAA